ncbi:hypothetical protein G6F68_015961 [Rhizopus microsporus]|nr:hypothetical protein G6F68_015961 [Rhizopus microsporus]
MDFVTEWFWFFLFVPLAALAGWPPVEHLFPGPELPAQRAAGQGHRAVPAYRRAGQGNLRDPGRAGPPVPPPRRSRPRHPPAPGPGQPPRSE